MGLGIHNTSQPDRAFPCVIGHRFCGQGLPGLRRFWYFYTNHTGHPRSQAATHIAGFVIDWLSGCASLVKSAAGGFLSWKGAGFLTDTLANDRLGRFKFASQLTGDFSSRRW